MRAEPPGPGPPPNRAERGFTLLEALVALAIAAFALGPLFHGAVQARLSAGLAARYEEALARARSRLAAAEAMPLRPVAQSGEDGGGFRWQMRIAPIAAAAPEQTQGPPAAAGGPAPMLYLVGVTVSWRAEGDGGGERAVRLETRRLGLAPPRAP